MDRTMLEQLQNADVFSTSGDKIGSVGQVYLDDSTEEPTFITVKTGLFGTKETFVPLDRAQTAEGGITVPFEKDFVKDAPNVDADANLTPEEEQRIYEYYSMDYADGRDDVRDDRDGVRHDRDEIRQDPEGLRDDRTTAGTAGAAGAAGAAGVAANGDRRDDHRAEGVRADEPRHAGGHVDADRDRAAADRDGVAAGRDGLADGRTAADRDGVRDEESMVVRDEQLNVGTERRASGRVRLRKQSYTTTEQVEVPVQREEVVVERESVDPNSAEARTAGRGDDAVEVTTYEDVPVAEKTVDAEKVSLGKRTHKDTETVSEELQHEDVEVDRDGGVRRDGVDRDGKRR